MKIIIFLTLTLLFSDIKCFTPISGSGCANLAPLIPLAESMNGVPVPYKVTKLWLFFCHLKKMYFFKLEAETNFMTTDQVIELTLSKVNESGPLIEGFILTGFAENGRIFGSFITKNK